MTKLNHVTATHQHQAPSVARRNGFTIIELLVVVGIIVVLISILLPSLGSSRREAIAAQCGSNLHHLVNAYSMVITSGDKEEADLHAFGWQDTLGPYLGDEREKILVCPEHERENPFQNAYQASDLVLQVINGGGTHLYDMALKEEQWTLRIDKNSDAAKLAKPNPDVTQAEIDALEDNQYYLFFEDLRPHGGDMDFRDVVLLITESTNGQVQVSYIGDSAGYTFNLATTDGEIIWADMNIGGTSAPGSTSGEFEVSFGSYGMNSSVNELIKVDRNRLILVDYMQAVANIDEGVPDDWTQWKLPEWDHPAFLRHNNFTANAAYSHGAVLRVQQQDIDPDVPGVLDRVWDPTPGED